MHRVWKSLFIIALAFFLFSGFSPALAQEEQPPSEAGALTFFTDYPAQVIGLGETVTLPLTLRTTMTAQVVILEMKTIPTGWTATFRGGGRIVKSAFVEPEADATVDLRLEPPAEVKAGSYSFVAVASGADGVQVELPIELTVQEKLPARLTLEVELPTLKGTPSTTFRYDTTLKNEGDEEITVNLSAEAAEMFEVSFKFNGQDVTNLPVGPKESKRINVEAQPIGEVAAGIYPINVIAQGGEAQATLMLTAEVTGQSQLTLSTPDGRLSGTANAGRETPLKIVVRNTGSATARGIELSSSEPSGWAVRFEPAQIDEIPANQQVEVTTYVRPAQNAVAGDYMMTVRAQPADGVSRSAEFRITVLTSTLWGVVGIVLIAVAVGVVAIAVMRFGRR
ncbi:MAG: NEW3 domain-containing protein [Anaerolineales bacterium]|nr:NEW3 domain-containing protein [Anaerolineales bacterium]